MAITLAEVKAYMRVTDDADDALIARLMSMSQQYLCKAGITASEDDPAYEHAIEALTLHYFDNRGDIITGTIVSSIPFALREIINQLRYT